jgi:hypothetical protein
MVLSTASGSSSMVYVYSLADPVNPVVESSVTVPVPPLAGSVLFIVVSPLFGLLVDAGSLSLAFVILGAFFLLTGVPLVGAMFRHWREA